MAKVALVHDAVKTSDVKKSYIINIPNYDTYTLELPDHPKNKIGLPNTIYIDGMRYYCYPKEYVMSEKAKIKNKQNMNERNSSRYHTDPVYRQKVIDNAKKSYEKKKLQK